MSKNNSAEFHLFPEATALPQKVPMAFVKGTVIGMYKDHPIYDQLTDNHGFVRAFAGIASISQSHKPGSIIASPGLLYELV